MKQLKFVCARRMDGDKQYKPGDTRTLSAVDAAQLVRSGALKPADDEAKAAMETLLGLPANQWGVMPAKMILADPDAAAETDAPVTELSPPAPAKPAAKKPASKPKAAAPAKAKDAGDAPRNKADVAAPGDGAQRSQSENGTDGEGGEGEGGEAPKETEGSAEGEGGPAKTAAPTENKGGVPVAPKKRR